MFHRVTSQGRKIFEARQQADRDFLRKLLDTFQDLACRGKLKLSSLCTHSRGYGGVKEVTTQVYDRTSREAKQGKTKSPGQVASPLASQAEFLRRVETYRKNWQRYLKGILAGFHMHLGVAAAQALYQRLCKQHRQLASTDP